MQAKHGFMPGVLLSSLIDACVVPGKFPAPIRLPSNLGSVVELCPGPLSVEIYSFLFLLLKCKHFLNVFPCVTRRQTSSSAPGQKPCQELSTTTLGARTNVECNLDAVPVVQSTHSSIASQICRSERYNLTGQLACGCANSSHGR
jgi:hypothetical protein